MRLRILIPILVVLILVAGVMYVPTLYGRMSAWLALRPRIVSTPTEVPCPGKEHPLFTVTAPAKWKVSPMPKPDDYVTLEGPSGASLYLRVVSGNLDKIVEEGRDELNESYKSPELAEPRTIQLGGRDATVIDGTGTEVKSKMAFSLAWVSLPNGHFAEVWIEADGEDPEDLPIATNVRETFKVVE